MERISNIILTGELRTGKSTLVRHVLKRLDTAYQGLFCEKLIEDKNIVGYVLRRTNDSRPLIFAHKSFDHDVSMGPFGCDSSAFDQAASFLESCLTSASQLIVLDEIGVIEENSFAYLAVVESVLNSTKSALIVVQKRADYMWRRLNTRQDCIPFEVTRENRDSLIDVIERHLLELVKNRT